MTVQRGVRLMAGTLVLLALAAEAHVEQVGLGQIGPGLGKRVVAPHRRNVLHEKRVEMAGRFAPGDLASADEQQAQPRGPVDRAIDAAATQQRGIGGIDDRVDGKRGDVPLDDCDSVSVPEGRDRREDRRGLASAGRPDHEQVVRTSRGDFEGAFDVFLPFDLRKVGREDGRDILRFDGGLGRDGNCSGKMRIQRSKRGRRDNFQAGDQGGFCCVDGRGEDALEALLASQSRHRQYAAHVAHHPIQ